MAVTPDALDICDTGLLQVVPNTRCKKRYSVAFCNRKQRRVAKENGIIAMQDSLYPHDALLAAVRVITRPLAEGSFHPRFFFRRRDLAFENDFRRGRHRQAVQRS